MIWTRSTIALALMSSAGLFGQEGMHRMRGPAPGPGAPGDFVFRGAQFSFAGRVVKGAPYSAQAVTQFTQTLADGNRIQRTNTASIARDSEGRTRTEESMAGIGAMAASDRNTKVVFIHDPVAGMSYALDPNRRIARQMQVSFRGRAEGAPEHGPRPGAEARGDDARPRQTARPEVKTEDLGIQTMEGVAVQGRRVTRTIPAAQAGSQRDIEVVTETWVSQDLQAVVMSKTSDPRFGDTIYKLTNVSRTEPDHSLFSVPSDYTVQQGPRRGPGAPQ
jgi:hypothetical protein